MPEEGTQMERHFTLEYWMDDDWYVGKLKEVPGVFSQGATLDELETNIRDAHHLMVEPSCPPGPPSGRDPCLRRAYQRAVRYR